MEGEEEEELREAGGTLVRALRRCEEEGEAAEESTDFVAVVCSVGRVSV